MAPRFLLDTNSVIYIRRRHPIAVLSHFEKLTYGELLYGLEKAGSPPRGRHQLEELATLISILPLPREAVRAYGMIRADLESSRATIGQNDLWIAAHASAADLTLVTNNEREFRRVRGLKVENWIA